MKLADINDRIAFLIKEGKLKNQPPHVKRSYFILSSSPDTLYISVSGTDSTTPTITNCQCANYLNSIKEHISVLNTEIIAMRSFILEQMVVLKRPASPIPDIYPN